MTRLAASLLVVIILLATFCGAVSATRGTNARYYGPVTLDSKNLLNTDINLVTGYIGSLSWTTSVYFKGTDSYYVLDIPWYSGIGIKNGGVNGDLVNFSLSVNGVTYNNPTTSKFIKATDFTRSLRFYTSGPVNGPVITTDQLPEGVVGYTYAAQLEASQGTAPYTWSAGDLPEGIQIQTDGILSGTPLKAGTFYPVFMVTDFVNLPSQPVTIAITIWKLGDANHDTTVDRWDVYDIIKMYLGILPKTDAADVNQDGVIDLRDAVKVQSLFD
jgi:hypothetical protein